MTDYNIYKLCRFDGLNRVYSCQKGFNRKTHQYTIHITGYKLGLFMRNQLNRVKHVYTMQINRLKPVLFMLNRFDWLEDLYTMQINRFIPV